jgi:hypothetical protein
MDNTMYISLSTKNLDIINKVCQTEYEYNNETDFDAYSFDHASFKGIYFLEANNFIVLVNTPTARYPLSYSVNKKLLLNLSYCAYLEYLSSEIAIVWLENMIFTESEYLRTNATPLCTSVEFIKSKAGRHKA